MARDDIHKLTKQKEENLEWAHELGHTRCPYCGKDVEKVYPIKAEVSKETYYRIIEIDSTIKLLGTSIVDRLDKQLDDISMKIIEGLVFNISLNVCVECLDELGRKHKFNKLRKLNSYATKRL